ncbi:hypothetical protein POM88_042051 [Heracleum sosnowskyi]|uniref:GRF-type domain-containing protein n=1 Tax=Heracleum sosnowskyi TaxID=360622 RepID=A0AAD8HI80_9APIA|nr:hypothetical protein POM88_042051 [Heracleum sosnowskyi]
MAFKCSCGRFTVQKMAWTEKNAGRRFIACDDRYGGCGYFELVDPPLATREHTVINRLLNRIKVMEDGHMRGIEEIKGHYEKEIEKLQQKAVIPLYVYVIFVCFVLFMVVNAGSNEK